LDQEAIMAETTNYPLTHQGVRNLDSPRRALTAETSKVNVGSDERAVSTLSGGVLAGFALGMGGLCGLILGTVGAALVYRGLSGHCSAYAAIGINTAK
jgi:uncharacterized membrane protein